MSVVSGWLVRFADQRFNGTAGVSPAASSRFTPAGVESFDFYKVAFNESGRDARAPSSKFAQYENVWLLLYNATSQKIGLQLTTDN